MTKDEFTATLSLLGWKRHDKSNSWYYAKRGVTLWGGAPMNGGGVILRSHLAAAWLGCITSRLYRYSEMLAFVTNAMEKEHGIPAKT